MKKQKLIVRPWTYSLLIVAVVIAVAYLVWCNGDEELFRLMREANLPLLLR